jgi:hypothetical protein
MKYTLILILISTVDGSGQNTESVCQVLATLETRSQKIVQLRDKYIGDTFVGGQKCQGSVRVAGLEFENIIHLDWPGSPSVIARKLEVPFGFDADSANTLEHAIGSWNRRSQDLYVTIEGLLVTKKPPLNLVVMRNPPQRMGFGPEGAAPAEIIVKRLVDVTAIQRK